MKKTLLSLGIAAAILSACNSGNPPVTPFPTFAPMTVAPHTSTPAPATPSPSPSPSPSPLPTDRIILSYEMPSGVPTATPFPPTDPRTVFDSATPSIAVTSTPNPIPSAAPRATHFPLARIGKRGEKAVVVMPDGGGQSGISIPADHGYTAVWAYLSVYPHLELNYFANLGGDILYAPTVKCNECLIELGADYAQNRDGTFRFLRNYDFTPGRGIGWNVPASANREIDDTFVAAYARDVFADGIPRIAVGIGKLSNGSWASVIANYTTGKVELLYVTAPSKAIADGGWFMKETHYAVGVCPATPPIAADVLVLGPSGWGTVSTTPAGPSSSFASPFTWGSCWNATQPSPFYATTFRGVAGWTDVTK